MMVRRVFFAVCAAVMTLPYPLFADDAAHAEAGVPQFDPTYFASQVFWLIISGLAMYTLMARFIVPRVGRMIDLRDDQVRLNLEAASRLRDQAETLKIDYMHALRDADERAQSLIDRVVREAQKKQDEALTQSADNLTARLAQTEKTLAAQKEDVLKDLSSMAHGFSTSWIARIKNKAA